jgi:NADPH:quinone reductase-like Zn-dependent oxidoreductase
MQAVILTRFGPPDVLQLQEVAQPIPKEHEVLIRIHATTVSAGDCDLRGLHFPLAYRPPMRLYVGLIRPKPVILGQELAGEIEAVGKAVTRFKKGEQVCAWTGLALGADAEYTCQPETGVLARKPSSMTYEEAAPLAVGGLEAMHFMKRGNIQAGQKVLIYGAGGSIGTFAVQLARSFRAEVTAMDKPDKLAMLRSIGADHVIDYTRVDFTRSGETYDVIFDVIGKSKFSRSIRSLTPAGHLLLGNPRLADRVRRRWVTRGRGQGRTVIPWASRTASESLTDFQALTELIAAGSIKTVIDSRYPFERIAEAHRRVETGRKQGNVVITVGHRSDP